MGLNSVLHEWPNHSSSGQRKDMFTTIWTATETEKIILENTGIQRMPYNTASQFSDFAKEVEETDDALWENPRFYYPNREYEDEPINYNDEFATSPINPFNIRALIDPEGTTEGSIFNSTPESVTSIFNLEFRRDLEKLIQSNAMIPASFEELDFEQEIALLDELLQREYNAIRPTWAYDEAAEEDCIRFVEDRRNRIRQMRRKAHMKPLPAQLQYPKFQTPLISIRRLWERQPSGVSANDARWVHVTFQPKQTLLRLIAFSHSFHRRKEFKSPNFGYVNFRIPRLGTSALLCSTFSILLSWRKHKLTRDGRDVTQVAQVRLRRRHHIYHSIIKRDRRLRPIPLERCSWSGWVEEQIQISSPESSQESCITVIPVRNLNVDSELDNSVWTSGMPMSCGNSAPGTLVDEWEDDMDAVPNRAVQYQRYLQSELSRYFTSRPTLAGVDESDSLNGESRLNRNEYGIFNSKPMPSCSKTEKSVFEVDEEVHNNKYYLGAMLFERNPRQVPELSVLRVQENDKEYNNFSMWKSVPEQQNVHEMGAEICSVETSPNNAQLEVAKNRSNHRKPISPAHSVSIWNVFEGPRLLDQLAVLDEPYDDTSGKADTQSKPYYCSPKYTDNNSCVKKEAGLLSMSSPATQWNTANRGNLTYSELVRTTLAKEIVASVSTVPRQSEASSATPSIESVQNFKQPRPIQNAKIKIQALMEVKLPDYTVKKNKLPQLWKDVVMSGLTSPKKTVVDHQQQPQKKEAPPNFSHEEFPSLKTPVFEDNLEDINETADVSVKPKRMAKDSSEIVTLSVHKCEDAVPELKKIEQTFESTNISAAQNSNAEEAIEIRIIPEPTTCVTQAETTKENIENICASAQLSEVSKCRPTAKSTEKPMPKEKLTRLDTKLAPNPNRIEVTKYGKVRNINALAFKEREMEKNREKERLKGVTYQESSSEAAGKLKEDGARCEKQSTKIKVGKFGKKVEVSSKQRKETSCEIKTSESEIFKFKSPVKPKFGKKGREKVEVTPNSTPKKQMTPEKTKFIERARSVKPLRFDAIEEEPKEKIRASGKLKHKEHNRPKEPTPDWTKKKSEGKSNTLPNIKIDTGEPDSVVTIIRDSVASNDIQASNSEVTKTVHEIPIVKTQKKLSPKRSSPRKSKSAESLRGVDSATAQDTIGLLEVTQTQSETLKKVCPWMKKASKTKGKKAEKNKKKRARKELARSDRKIDDEEDEDGYVDSPDENRMENKASQISSNGQSEIANARAATLAKLIQPAIPQHTKKEAQSLGELSVGKQATQTFFKASKNDKQKEPKKEPKSVQCNVEPASAPIPDALVPSSKVLKTIFQICTPEALGCACDEEEELIREFKSKVSDWANASKKGDVISKLPRKKSCCQTCKANIFEDASVEALTIDTQSTRETGMIDVTVYITDSKSPTKSTNSKSTKLETEATAKDTIRYKLNTKDKTGQPKDLKLPASSTPAQQDSAGDSMTELLGCINQICDGPILTADQIEVDFEYSEKPSERPDTPRGKRRMINPVRRLDSKRNLITSKKKTEPSAKDVSRDFALLAITMSDKLRKLAAEKEVGRSLSVLQTDCHDVSPPPQALSLESRTPEKGRQIQSNSTNKLSVQDCVASISSKPREASRTASHVVSGSPISEKTKLQDAMIISRKPESRFSVELVALPPSPSPNLNIAELTPAPGHGKTETPLSSASSTKDSISRADKSKSCTDITERPSILCDKISNPTDLVPASRTLSTPLVSQNIGGQKSGSSDSESNSDDFRGNQHTVACCSESAGTLDTSSRGSYFRGAFNMIASKFSLSDKSPTATASKSCTSIADTQSLKSDTVDLKSDCMPQKKKKISRKEKHSKPQPSADQSSSKNSILDFLFGRKSQKTKDKK